MTFFKPKHRRVIAYSGLNTSPTWGLHQSACCIKTLFACVLQICIGHAFDEQRIQAVLTKVSIRPAYPCSLCWCIQQSPIQCSHRHTKDIIKHSMCLVSLFAQNVCLHNSSAFHNVVLLLSFTCSLLLFLSLIIFLEIFLVRTCILCEHSVCYR